MERGPGTSSLEGEERRPVGRWTKEANGGKEKDRLTSRYMARFRTASPSDTGVSFEWLGSEKCEDGRREGKTRDIAGLGFLRDVHRDRLNLYGMPVGLTPKALIFLRVSFKTSLGSITEASIGISLIARTSVGLYLIL